MYSESLCLEFVLESHYHNILCPVAAKSTLREVRQLYFKLKEQIFGKSRAGMAYDTDALERLLRETFGGVVHMNDVKHPK